MKTPPQRLLVAACLVALAMASPLNAQPEAELDVHPYAGLTIMGEVGTVYSVDYVMDLTDPAESDWRCLEFFQLPASPYLWVDKSAPATDKRFYRAVAIDAPTNMVFIPPGTFMMGSPTNELDRTGREGPQTAVTISRGFWMGRCEVTQGEYLSLMNTNPSFFTSDSQLPVEQVTWEDATHYCGQLTQRERNAGRIATNNEYRLPTEAEWEYACRAWTSTRFSYGEDPDYTKLTDYAWYAANSGAMTHPVGQKLPNPWGLHDMHGSVFEWCQDYYTNTYQGGIALDPTGPRTGTSRVVRNGAWNGWGNSAGSCRSAHRREVLPDAGGSGIGFRAVLAPAQ